MTTVSENELIQTHASAGHYRYVKNGQGFEIDLNHFEYVEWIVRAVLVISRGYGDEEKSVTIAVCGTKREAVEYLSGVTTDADELREMAGY